MLTRLVIRDFRNYVSAELKFDSSTNILVGHNGQGKTNLLEAIFFLSMLRSFRTAQIRDLKRLNTPGFYLAADLAGSKAWETTVEVDYFQKRKLSIDHNPVAKASEFIKLFSTVVFSPDDILIVTGSSSLRRRFMDMLISSINPLYLNALQRYQSALGQRNYLLKNRHQDPALFQVYEAIIAENGTYIVTERQRMSLLISKEVEKLILKIKQDDTEFDIQYRYSAETDDNNAFLERLERDRDKDRDKGWTSVGPQLDDFEMLLNEKLLRNYGSTGQCRLTALCLKMAKLSILNNDEIERDVIALVDDVTGELDLPTKTEFYQVINKAEQIFFTFTEVQEDAFFSDAAIFEVDNGEINKRSL
jgi:DNA replication and repair protein RecF